MERLSLPISSGDWQIRVYQPTEPISQLVNQTPLYSAVSDVVEKKRRLVVEVESLASSWKKLRRVDVNA